jgi:hypothetical protein
MVAWSYGADVALLTAKTDQECFRSAFLYEPSRHTHPTGEPLEMYFRDASLMFAGLGQIVFEQGVISSAEQLVDLSTCQEGF